MPVKNGKTIGVLGLGRRGSALVRSLVDLGEAVITRDRNTQVPLADWVAQSHVICLAVRDDQIPGVTRQLASLALAGKIVLFHSGTVGLEQLAPLEQAGAIIGKFHPLQAFTQAAGQPVPPGTPWALEGEVEALVAPWVEAWSGKLYQLSGDQWLAYHLAAVTAANFLPLFIRAGAQVLIPLAADQADALAWLGPLVRHSVKGALDPTNALPFSGPAIREDDSTIEAHEAYLAQHFPEILELYKRATQVIRALPR